MQHKKDFQAAVNEYERISVVGMISVITLNP